jgi:tRNA (cytidine/uridine-2'-O-)-methyltransferase
MLECLIKTRSIKRNLEIIHIALYQPEIPPNTGNIIRLSANTGSCLHLIHPLGFSLDSAQLRRAGMDYHALAHVIQHASYEDFLAATLGQRIWICSTKSEKRYTDASFLNQDILLLGPETRGLPDLIRLNHPSEQCITIPMIPGNRSLNLSNACAVLVYEAWRQFGFVSNS